MQLSSNATMLPERRIRPHRSFIPKSRLSCVRNITQERGAKPSQSDVHLLLDDTSPIHQLPNDCELSLDIFVHSTTLFPAALGSRFQQGWGDANYCHKEERRPKLWGQTTRFILGFRNRLSLWYIFAPTSKNNLLSNCHHDQNAEVQDHVWWWHRASLGFFSAVLCTSGHQSD